MCRSCHQHFSLSLYWSLSCIIAISSWYIFRIIHHGVDEVPQTKMDWLLHVTTPRDAKLDDSHSPVNCRNVAGDQANLSVSLPEQMTSQENFESAAYVRELPRARSLTERFVFPSRPGDHSYSSCAKEATTSTRESITSNFSNDAPSIDIVLASPSKELTESIFREWNSR